MQGNATKGVRGGQGRSAHSVTEDATGFAALALITLAALAMAALVAGGAA